MRHRLRQLDRLHALRASQERLREAELAREQAMLNQAKQHAEAARAALETEVRVSRDLLLAGDTGASRIAEGVALACSTWSLHCEQRVLVCEKGVEAATLRRRESRLQVERSEKLSDGVRKTLAVEEQRRAQGVSDERFAARQHWNVIRKQR